MAEDMRRSMVLPGSVIMPRSKRVLRSALMVAAVLLLGLPVSARAQDSATAAGAAAAPDSAGGGPEAVRPGENLFFVKGRNFGTDAYGGPFDVIFNKGFAVAQWQGQDRNIFSYPYGWRAVWASIAHPGPAMERAGGWGAVLKRHLLPFGGDELREGQWVPNYFGHVFEGGLAYRRLLEWNRVHGVPFSTLAAVLVTQFAVAVNEAYETPVDDPWVQENGTAGLFIDFVIMDPLGMILFHQDGVSRFVAEKLGATIWPRQASITFPGGQLINNGEAVVVRPKLWFTDSFRLFVRGGIGVEAGISVPREDGLEVAVGIGAQSYERRLNPDSHLETAQFAFSSGIWIDRDGSLLFQATWDEKTDRRLAIDVFPGVISVGGATVGAWFQLDREHRAYLGITARRSLGAGLGVGF